MLFIEGGQETKDWGEKKKKEGGGIHGEKNNHSEIRTALWK